MRIAFLAMSGIRAHDPELVALGLTFPGVLDRSKVIASLPSLGLLYLAAVTPAGHELRYFEAEGDGNEPAEVYDFDLVAISTFSAQVDEAYAIADRLRAKGVRVAMGGLHVSVLPDEATNHADYVIVGEGENVWPAVVAAADRGEASRVFRSDDFPPVDVARLPVPRYDLLDAAKYSRFTVQTSRGCPWRCDFCASTVMLQKPYRKRPVEDVVRDIRAILAHQPGAFIEFADDNTFVDKAWGKALCRALIPLGIKWFTETDISVADDDELLGLMRDAGCRQVLIGLESPTRAGLDGIELHANFKAKRADRYLEAIRAVQRHKITVNGCFVLGLDGHGPEVFEQVAQFVDEAGLWDVQITAMTPFPGTPLYDRLKAAGRLLRPDSWKHCTLFDVNFLPTGMRVDDLRAGLRWLTQKIYSEEAIDRRRRRFFEVDPD
jgi:radical SAM superfamily enzyme YgiQ (UPF0313 family)